MLLIKVFVTVVRLVDLVQLSELMLLFDLLFLAVLLKKVTDTELPSVDHLAIELLNGPFR